jgi:hypothetical protein
MHHFSQVPTAGASQNLGYPSLASPQGLCSLNDILLSNAWMPSCRASMQSKIWPDPQSMANIFATLPGDCAAAQCGGFPYSNLQNFHGQQQQMVASMLGSNFNSFPHGPAHNPAEIASHDFASCRGNHSGESSSEEARTPSSSSASATCVNKIFPRRKAGQSFRLNSKPVVLDEKVPAPFLP